MIKDVGGQTHPTIARRDGSLFWCRVLKNTVVEAYLNLEHYSDLARQASVLQVLYKKYKSHISPLKDLPEEYLVALLKFQYYLEQGVKGPQGQLRVCVIASPPIREYYERAIPASDTTPAIAKLDTSTQTLTWLLRTIWEDGKEVQLLELSNVVDELERFLQCDARARNQISSYVAGVIGDLSVLAECQRQLSRFQPWANNFIDAGIENDRFKAIKKDFVERHELVRKLLEALTDTEAMALVDKAKPGNQPLAYPFEKRRTRENVEKLQYAEANLDRIWAEVDRIVRDKAGNLKGTALWRLLSQDRTNRRTPDSVEPAATSESAGPETTKAEAPLKPFSPVNFVLWSETTEHEPVKAKTKIKTRGTPTSTAMSSDSTTANEASSLETDAAPACPQPVVTVNTRAAKVFRMLFFNPGAAFTPGEVAWTDFLHAMSTMGFRAEKLYGSVWHFLPTWDSIERSIQFHAPHPGGKLAFHTARRIRRSLFRAYGWDGPMFVAE
ncbi:hypothetical protein HDU87_000897 [Geranomyces variabilis]|uniref:Uncharacterized protein n=1 Tax=Geranomyces variabilis TaxID=109894 RepID=A0AAD5XM48_9FUNG|nr:hypothetical protein HDU87_000897 [Geranomyces variabilis]